MVIRYYFFAIKWFWAHRGWKPTRQKFKAFDKAWLARRKELEAA